MDQKPPERPVKRDIEHHALRLFATKGFAHTSVREIVEAAGVTKPTLYYYFQNKADLHDKLINGYVERYLEEFDRIPREHGSLAERLRRIACLNFDFYRAEPLLGRFFFRVLFGFAGQIPEVDLSDCLSREVETILRILREGAEAGEIDPARVNGFTVTQFQGMIHIYAQRQAMGYEEELSPELAERIVDLLLQGIRKPPAGPAVAVDSEERTGS